MTGILGVRTVKVQRRGPITDVWVLDDEGRRREPCTTVCPHAEWPEGGHGCLECLTIWRRSWACLRQRTGSRAGALKWWIKLRVSR